MTTLEKEIIGLLDMIPLFPLEEKRDFVLNKMPTLSDEKKQKVFEELGFVFRELVAKIPITAFIESDLPLDTKKKILEIEKKYLYELQSIETNLLHEFLEQEKKIRSQELERAEKMLYQQFGI